MKTIMVKNIFYLDESQNNKAKFFINIDFYFILL